MSFCGRHQERSRSNSEGDYEIPSSVSSDRWADLSLCYRQICTACVQSVHPCAKLACSQLAVRVSPIDVQADCVHRTPRLLPSRLKPHLFHPVEKSCWALALPPDCVLSILYGSGAHLIPIRLTREDPNLVRAQSPAQPWPPHEPLLQSQTCSSTSRVMKHSLRSGSW